MKKLPLLGCVVLSALIVSGCGGDDDNSATTAAGTATAPAAQTQPPSELDDLPNRFSDLSQKERSEGLDQARAKVHRVIATKPEKRLPRSLGSVPRPRSATAEGCNPTISYYGWQVTECTYVYNYSDGWTRVSTFSWFKYPHLWVYDQYGVLGLGSGWIQFA